MCLFFIQVRLHLSFSPYLSNTPHSASTLPRTKMRKRGGYFSKNCEVWLCRQLSHGLLLLPFCLLAWLLWVPRSDRFPGEKATILVCGPRNPGTQGPGAHPWVWGSEKPGLTTSGRGMGGGSPKNSTLCELMKLCGRVYQPW